MVDLQTDRKFLLPTISKVLSRLSIVYKLLRFEYDQVINQHILKTYIHKIEHKS